MQDAIEACYSILGTVQRLWRRVKHEDDDDYIAIPKPSGYQSLHTAVIGTFILKSILWQISSQTMRLPSVAGLLHHRYIWKDLTFMMCGLKTVRTLKAALCCRAWGLSPGGADPHEHDAPGGRVRPGRPLDLQGEHTPAPRTLRAWGAEGKPFSSAKFNVA